MSETRVAFLHRGTLTLRQGIEIPARTLKKIKLAQNASFFLPVQKQRAPRDI